MSIRFYKNTEHAHRYAKLQIDYIDAKQLLGHDLTPRANGFYNMNDAIAICQNLADATDQIVTCEMFATDPCVRIDASFYLYPSNSDES